MKCKDCQHYMKVAESYICDMSHSCFSTGANDECHYITGIEPKCSDCFRYYYSCAMTGNNADSYVNGCGGFIDIEPKRMKELLSRWLMRGIYSREKILRLCDEFERSEEYKFFQSLNKEDIPNGE